MKAIIWKDWLLCRRQKTFWLLGAIMEAITLTYIIGFILWLGTEHTLLVFMMFGPMVAYLSPILTVGTSYPNDNAHTLSMNEPLRTDGTVETMRCSGRPMAQYLLAKSAMPMLLGLSLLLPPVLYCLYGGALTLHDLVSPEMLYTLLTVLALTFTNEQVILASHATTSGTINIPIFLTAIPMMCFMVLSMFISPWVALLVMIAVGLLALTVSVIHSRHSYPTTFRRLS
ncbi:hypothetical protein EMO89_00790 [Bifidobacterium tissieri]|uniref:ABC-2 family transporter protein n=1 Tax=Bifidobacterium tissieri TaxID=1630162 RepID=A0A5M9ZXC0_9BIFI|nr:hypothetical protein [Bifidobacterium tissieri]KAA8832089.1 hypothetical protein EMO89_00790 [Bifidobacterium tissieri]